MFKTGIFGKMLMGFALALIAFSQDAQAQKTALEVGAEAPAFSVTGADGQAVTLEKATEDSELVVVVFTCNSCPVAKAYEQRLVDFDKKYQTQKVNLIAINSNTKTEDLEAVKKKSTDDSLNYVYAFDATGQAAKDFKASVTPEVFVIQDGKIAYHGAFDDSLKSPTKHYLANAVDALLADKQPETVSTKAFGCGIKSK